MVFRERVNADGRIVVNRLPSAARCVKLDGFAHDGAVCIGGVHAHRRFPYVIAVAVLFPIDVARQIEHGARRRVRTHLFGRDIEDVSYGTRGDIVGYVGKVLLRFRLIRKIYSKGFQPVFFRITIRPRVDQRPVRFLIGRAGKDERGKSGV